MVEQLSLEIRKQIICHQIKGYIYQEIAEILNVSNGTISNVMKEHNNGLYPEFNVPEDELAFIRGICNDLKKYRIPIWEVYAAIQFLKHLRDLDVKPQDLPALMKVIGDINSEKLKKESIVDFAIRAHTMEEETGIAIEDLPVKLNDIQARITVGTAHLEKLNNEQARVKAEIESHKQERVSIHKDISISKQRISELVTTEDYLEKYGTDNVVKHVKHLDEILPEGAAPDHLETLYKIMKAVEKAGWPEDAVLDVLEQLDDLMGTCESKQNELNKLNTQVTALSRGLSPLQGLHDVLQSGLRIKCPKCNTSILVALPDSYELHKSGERLDRQCPRCKRWFPLQTSWFLHQIALATIG